jgi:hypothetical protein
MSAFLIKVQRDAEKIQKAQSQKPMRKLILVEFLETLRTRKSQL